MRQGENNTKFNFYFTTITWDITLFCFYLVLQTSRNLVILTEKASPETFFLGTAALHLAAWSAIIRIFEFPAPSGVHFSVPFFFDGLEWPLNGVHESVSFPHFLAARVVIARFARHWFAGHWLARHWLAWTADWLAWAANWFRGTFRLFAVPVRNFSAFGLGFAAFNRLGLVNGFGGWHSDGFFHFFAVRDLLGDPLGSVGGDLFADHLFLERWYANGDFDLFLGGHLNSVFFGSVGFFHDRFWWANWFWHADWLAWLADWLRHAWHLACLLGFAWVAVVVVTLVTLFTARGLAVSSEHVSDRLSETGSLFTRFLFFAALVVIARHGVGLLARGCLAMGWRWCT